MTNLPDEVVRGYGEGGPGRQGGKRATVQGSPGPEVSPRQAILRQSHGSGENLDGVVAHWVTSRGHAVVAHGVALPGPAWCHLSCFPHHLAIEVGVEKRQRLSFHQAKR